MWGICSKGGAIVSTVVDRYGPRREDNISYRHLPLAPGRGASAGGYSPQALPIAR